MSNHKDFLYAILAPQPKHSSAGTVALWKMADMLMKIGANVMTITYGLDGTLINGGANCDPTQFDTDHIIAIYPDIAIGNPLNAKHIVHYQLNRFGVLGGSMPSNDGFILNHSKAFGVCHHVLYNPFSLAEAVEYAEVNRGFDKYRYLKLMYQGKGDAGDNKVFNKCILEITREWPVNRCQLYKLLEVSAELYSYDSLSSLNLEAIILGVKVIPCGWIVTPNEYELNINMGREELCEGYYEYASKYRRDLVTFLDKSATFFQGKL